ncbi:MAG: hypothetical protein HY537_10840, partial [Deltaproteobacteria bacterium]|nr:hypothetical protein [Deltaproteobacteria bacterium]
MFKHNHYLRKLRTVLFLFLFVLLEVPLFAKTVREARTVEARPVEETSPPLASGAVASREAELRNASARRAKTVVRELFEKLTGLTSGEITVDVASNLTNWDACHIELSSNARRGQSAASGIHATVTVGLGFLDNYLTSNPTDDILGFALLHEYYHEINDKGLEDYLRGRNLPFVPLDQQRAFIAKAGRKHLEVGADIRAVAHLIRLGYQPQEAIRFFEQFKVGPPETTLSHLLRSHPEDRDRIKYIHGAFRFWEDKKHIYPNEAKSREPQKNYVQRLADEHRRLDQEIDAYHLSHDYRDHYWADFDTNYDHQIAELRTAMTLDPADSPSELASKIHKNKRLTYSSPAKPHNAGMESEYERRSHAKLANYEQTQRDLLSQFIAAAEQSVVNQIRSEQSLRDRASLHSDISREASIDYHREDLDLERFKSWCQAHQGESWQRLMESFLAKTDEVAEGEDSKKRKEDRDSVVTALRILTADHQRDALEELQKHILETGGNAPRRVGAYTTLLEEHVSNSSYSSVFEERLSDDVRAGFSERYLNRYPQQAVELVLYNSYVLDRLAANHEQHPGIRDALARALYSHDWSQWDPDSANSLVEALEKYQIDGSPLAEPMVRALTRDFRAADAVTLLKAYQQMPFLRKKLQPQVDLVLSVALDLIHNPKSVKKHSVEQLAGLDPRRYSAKRIEEFEQNRLEYFWRWFPAGLNLILENPDVYGEYPSYKKLIAALEPQLAELTNQIMQLSDEEFIKTLLSNIGDEQDKEPGSLRTRRADAKTAVQRSLYYTAVGEHSSCILPNAMRALLLGVHKDPRFNARMERLAEPLLLGFFTSTKGIYWRHKTDYQKTKVIPSLRDPLIRRLIERNLGDRARAQSILKQGLVHHGDTFNYDLFVNISQSPLTLDQLRTWSDVPPAHKVGIAIDHLIKPRSPREIVQFTEQIFDELGRQAQGSTRLKAGELNEALNSLRHLLEYSSVPRAAGQALFRERAQALVSGYFSSSPTRSSLLEDTNAFYGKDKRGDSDTYHVLLPIRDTVAVPKLIDISNSEAELRELVGLQHDHVIGTDENIESLFQKIIGSSVVSAETKFKLVSSLHRVLNADQLNEAWDRLVRQPYYNQPYDHDLMAKALTHIYASYYDGRARKLNEIAQHFLLSKPAIELLEDSAFRKRDSEHATVSSEVEVLQSAIKGAVSKRSSPADLIEFIRWLQGSRASVPTFATEVIDQLKRVEEEIEEVFNAYAREHGYDAAFERYGDTQIKIQVAKNLTLDRLRDVFRGNPIEVRAGLLLELIDPRRDAGLLAPRNQVGRDALFALMSNGIEKEHQWLAQILLDSYTEAMGDRGYQFVAEILGGMTGRETHQGAAEKLKDILEAKGTLWVRLGQMLGADSYLIPDESTRRVFRVLNERAAERSRKTLIEDLERALGDQFPKIKRIGELKGSGSVNSTIIVELQDGRILIGRVLKNDPDNSALFEQQRLQRMSELLRDRASALSPDRRHTVVKIADALENYSRVLTLKLQSEANLANDRKALTMLKGKSRPGREPYQARYQDLRAQVHLVDEAATDIEFNAPNETDKAEEANLPTSQTNHADPRRIIFYEVVGDEKSELEKKDPETFRRFRRAAFRAEWEALFRHGRFDPDGHTGNWRVIRAADGTLHLYRIDISQAEYLTPSVLDALRRVTSALLFKKIPRPATILLRQDDRYIAEALATLLEQDSGKGNYVGPNGRDLATLVREIMPTLLSNGSEPLRMLSELPARLNSRLPANRRVRFIVPIQLALKSVFLSQEFLDPNDPTDQGFIEREFLRLAVNVPHAAQAVSAVRTAEQWLKGTRLWQWASQWMPKKPVETLAEVQHKERVQFLAELLSKETGDINLEGLYEIYHQHPELRGKLSEHLERTLMNPPDNSRFSDRYYGLLMLLALESSSEPNELIRRLLSGPKGERYTNSPEIVRRTLALRAAMAQDARELFPFIFQLYADDILPYWMINDSSIVSLHWKEYVDGRISANPSSLPLARLIQLDSNLYSSAGEAVHSVISQTSDPLILAGAFGSVDAGSPLKREMADRIIEGLESRLSDSNWAPSTANQLSNLDNALFIMKDLPDQNLFRLWRVLRQCVERSPQWYLSLNRDRETMDFVAEEVRRTIERKLRYTVTDPHELHQFVQDADLGPAAWDGLKRAWALERDHGRRGVLESVIEWVAGHSLNQVLRESAQSLLSSNNRQSERLSQVQMRLGPERALWRAKNEYWLLDTSGPKPKILARFRHGDPYVRRALHQKDENDYRDKVDTMPVELISNYLLASRDFERFFKTLFDENHPLHAYAKEVFLPGRDREEDSIIPTHVLTRKDAETLRSLAPATNPGGRRQISEFLYGVIKKGRYALADIDVIELALRTLVD